jgi:hypothetical protein
LSRVAALLFPDYYSPYAKCKGCRTVHLKIDMYQMPGYGFFCTEEEASWFWLDHQI